MKTLRDKLSYANVVSTLCLFLLLGGGAAYAASQLGKNTVGTKQLKKNSVTTAKIRKEAVTATKVKKGTLTGTQINASTLGTVPTAQTANSAIIANSLPAAEPWHEVGAPGEPTFFSNWENASPLLVTAGFYKDQVGIVHLRGAVTGSGSAESIFKLPPGFRPTTGKQTTFSGYCAGGLICSGGNYSERIDALGSGFYIPELSGNVLAYPATLVSLSGITFRAES